MLVGSLPLHSSFVPTELGEPIDRAWRVGLIETIDGWVSWTENTLKPQSNGQSGYNARQTGNLNE